MPALSPRSTHDLDRRILSEVEAGRGLSQRSLARSVGIALGLANQMVRRLERRGLIEIVKVRPNRVRYVITAAGVAERSRITRAYLDDSLRFYAETRDRIRSSFASLSAAWPMQAGHAKRIVFYGAGEVAEIGYVCLQETDLTLVGIVDEHRDQPFFGLPVHRTEGLTAVALGGVEYGRIVIMSLRDTETPRSRLEAAGCPPDSIYTL